MSIDRDLDHYLEQRGITPSAEVVPDHACQIFEQPAQTTGRQLDDARELVERLLGQPGTAGSSGARGGLGGA